ncbi:cyclic nucleotide-binding domain-containing protein 2 [Bombina bombina]|uniref:cyclic nucleotide-binding domain-containing protein 2 n=1 Tax=Bombina bombina TaxID=8345 RepID=UPI00235A69BC|nr:cyclic nucleotide-binding domain-containing protein 2 [Bombina bombina]
MWYDPNARSRTMTVGHKVLALKPVKTDKLQASCDTWKSHLVHLGVILDCLRAAGLTLKPDKCTIGRSEVQYLGHQVGYGKQWPEPGKVEAVANWPTPRTKIQVLAFLGTAGYYQRFVPLTDLTLKRLPRQVLWSPKCEAAFQSLKSALVSAPVLAAPIPTKRFSVHTDASMFGLGAVLSQADEEGQDHPVAYISRKLLPREVGYAAVEECLALHLWDVVHKVIFLQKVIRTIIHNAEEARGSSFWGAVQVSNFPSEETTYEEEDKNKRRNKVSLAFDTKVFKSQYEFTFPEKAIEVALLRPEERSEQDIRFIRSMMMGILSFRRYSTQMQLMLARVVYYRRFGRGRIVVRKGHRGDSFYFVFSGVIAITQDEDGSSALLDPEPILLHKGASFGEVALLKGLRRNATVICMEDTEFLAVDREEFFRNKLDKELKKELEYRFNFFRSLDLFSSWSDQSLETLADHCKTEESHHSQVMVNDTSETKNIIFVTKGRCEVLRLVDLSQCPSFLKWIKQHETLLGRPMLPLEKSISKIHRTKEDDENNESRSFSAEQIRILANRGFLSAEDITMRNQFPVSSAVVPRSLEVPKGLVAAVYLRIDSLRPGQYFKGVDVHYIESCLERDGRPLQEPPLLPTLNHRDPRSMVIISQGAEVIRIRLDKFSELADVTTLEKLKEQIIPYPSDNELCRIFLQQNRWKVFKSDLVSHLSSSQCTHPKVHQKHPSTQAKARPCNKAADRTGILQLGTQNKDGEKFWTAPKKQKVPDPGRKEENSLPPIHASIRLIHGIDIPKLCGKRIMW